jgi:hypothetical protein
MRAATDSVTRHRSRPLQRRVRTATAFAALLALSIAAALPHGGHYGLHESLTDTAIAEGAIHPGARAHLEGSLFKLHPGCVACLLHLQLHSALASRTAASPAPPPEGGVLAQAQAPSPSAVFSPGPARAPPSLPAPI